MKLENNDYLDSQWMNKKLWEWHKGKYIIFCVNYSFKKGRPRTRWLSKSDNSKVGLGSAMKNTEINGLYKIWTRNHTVVTLKCEVNKQETTETFIF